MFPDQNTCDRIYKIIYGDNEDIVNMSIIEFKSKGFLFCFFVFCFLFKKNKRQKKMEGNEIKRTKILVSHQ